MHALEPAQKRGKQFQNPVETQVGGLSIMFKVLPLYFSKEEERVPRQPLGPFRTDASIYREPPASGLRVTWLGHSSMLLETDGLRVLIDPMYDERASPMRWMGPRRFFAPPLAISELPAIDAVLISHDHFDHLGKSTTRTLARHPSLAQARWITSLGVGTLLRRFGVRAESITELGWMDSTRVSSGSGELSITALPARHFSGRSLWNRFETLWSSFAIKGNRHRVYFGADSGMWDGFGAIGCEHGPFDLVMLEIGAYHDLWRDIHMGPDGAAEAFAHMGGSGLLMPIHWGLFDLALHGWRQPIERMTELADRDGVRLWSPEPGRPTEVHPGEEYRSTWWHPS